MMAGRFIALDFNLPRLTTPGGTGARSGQPEARGGKTGLIGGSLVLLE